MSIAKQYRKKPVVIEAMQVLDDIRQHIAIRQWSAEGTPEGEPIPISITAFDSSMIIHTLEGDMRADLGDYIIKGVNGEFYPCKPDIFAKTYDSVDGDDLTIRQAIIGEEEVGAVEPIELPRICDDHAHIAATGELPRHA